MKPETNHHSHRAVLANLRHELRTPLNAIIGYSEMLIEDAEDVTEETFVSDLRNIHSAGKKSLELVNSILDPEKLESEQVRIGLETFGANLRHELRTPSNAMLSLTEVLLKKAEAPDQNDPLIQDSISDLKKIYDASRNFLTLIRNTENLSEADSGIAEIKAFRTPKKKEQPAAADSGNLLVVDDNEMNRDLLSRHLMRQGHRVSLAENGREALAMLEQDRFDVVLLDIMMPEMDGYETLKRMKSHETWQYIPVIMISALDEMAGVARCIETGAEDYLSRPFDAVLLSARIGAVMEKKRLRDKEHLYLKSLERELDIAREIQASFLPDALPEIPGWEIEVCFHPARQVAGDFYDAFLLPGGEGIGIVVADVCGKGVGAALFMGLFRSLIRAFTDLHSDLYHYDGNRISADIAADEDALKTIMTLTNDYIARHHGKSNMFATIFFGLILPSDGTLIYINGGHEPPVIVGKNGMKARLTPTGPAVGMLPDMVFETGKAILEPGDTLTVFTDGITEAFDSEGKLYTKERLFKLLSDTAPECGNEIFADSDKKRKSDRMLSGRFALSARDLIARIESDLREHTAGAEQSDDITLLAVRRKSTIDLVPTLCVGT
jgi:two-component system response regulator